MATLYTTLHHGPRPSQDKAYPAGLAARIRLRCLRAALNAAGETIGRGLFAPRYAGSGVIFMLHRVVRNNTPILYPGYEISLESLDSALALVRRSGWDIVSMDEVCRRLGDPGDQRRFACFTFDDGYSDNYTLALPLFASYGAPMCVYINTGIFDKSMNYWWGGLEELIARNEELEVPFPNSPARRFDVRTLQQKRRLYDLLDAECHHDHDTFLPCLTSAFERYHIEPARLLGEHALTVEQARAFASHPLVTIGSHAVTHRRLCLLPETEAGSEITNSRTLLEELLDVPVRHIAYPFGGQDACGEREFALAQAAGYKSGVTSQAGNIFPEHRDQIWMLPRHTLVQDPATVRNCLFGTQALLKRPRRQ